MLLTDYLDKGASLGPEKPCLTTDGLTLSYAETQAFSYRFARAIAAAGVSPGAKIAVLSGNDPVAFACVFGISRAGCVWCPINPRNEAAETHFILDNFDAEVLIFSSDFAAMVAKMRPDLSKLRVIVCLDAEVEDAPSLDRWLEGLPDDALRARAGRRRRDDSGHRRHDGQAERRDADRRQSRSDDRHHADELPVRGRARLSRLRAADARRRRVVLSDSDARRPHRDHAQARSRRVPAADRGAPRHPRVPAADRDLHGARPSRARRRPICRRCNAFGTAPRRWRRRASKRRCAGSGRWRNCLVRPKRR